MEQEELLQRLTALENARAEDMQKAAQQAFMSKYGSRISNNEGLGLVILNELNRRGVDTSAADEAVQEILDGLRMEARALLDQIKEANDFINNLQDQAINLEDKADDIQDAVQSAAEKKGIDLTLPSEDMQNGGASSGVADNIEPPMDTVQPANIPEYDPSELGLDEAEGQPAEEPPAEEPPAPQQGEQAPEQQVVSDERMKQIFRPNKSAISAYKKTLSDKRMKNVIPAHLLNACRG